MDNQLYRGLRAKGIFKQSSHATPLVTVITVVRNGEACIEQTIKSVLSQSYENIEYIVIDGASTDNTVNLINKFSDSIDFWISEPDLGIYDAINKGISCATGEILNILNAGDYYLHPGVISEYVNLFSRYPHSYWAYSRVVARDEHGIFCANHHIEFGLSKFDRDICHQSMFYKKELHSIAGLYDTRYRYAADRHFILTIRVLNRYEPLFLDKSSIVFQLGGVGNAIGAIQEVKRIHEEIFKGVALIRLKTKYLLKLCRKTMITLLERGRLRPLVTAYKKLRLSARNYIAKGSIR